VMDRESSLARVVVNCHTLIFQIIVPMIKLIRYGCRCGCHCVSRCVLDFVLRSKVSVFGELKLGSVIVDLDVWELEAEGNLVGHRRHNAD
ncbi:hypothetical protein HAX54_012865, partial [Datura stramonium]|nr:hypothetical protein [Datura stramonium]